MCVRFSSWPKACIRNCLSKRATYHGGWPIVGQPPFICGRRIHVYQSLSDGLRSKSRGKSSFNMRFAVCIDANGFFRLFRNRYCSAHVAGRGTNPLFFRRMAGFGVIAILIVLRYALMKQKSLAAERCGLGIKKDVRMGLLNKLFMLGPAFINRERTGNIASSISTKVEYLNDYYTIYLPNAVACIVNAIPHSITQGFTWSSKIECCCT